MGRPFFTIATPLAAGFWLAGCGDAPVDDESGLTAAEERQLDQAAERLDREREAYEAGMEAQGRADAAAAEDGGETP